MKVAIVKESAPNERRVALVPEAVGKLTGAGHEILIQTGAGDGASIPDADFTAAGAKVVAEDALYAEADVVLRAPARENIRAKTDGEGKLDIDVPPGDYILEVPGLEAAKMTEEEKLQTRGW